MSKHKKIVVVNLCILALYTVLIFFMNGSGSHRGLGILIGSMVLIAIQVGINIIVSLVFFAKKQTELGKVYLLSAAVVLIIGFSSCWGSSALVS